MPKKNIHIGELIQKRQEEYGMSAAELGRRLNRSSQSLYNIYKNESIDAQLLADIGKALDTDFFRYYQLDGPTVDKLAKGKKTSRKMSISFEVDEDKQEQVLKLLGITVK